jgi:hypothetical protein
MKSRPRRAEREIANLLSDIFGRHGYDAVERIPVLGRTGPDISLNAFGLVVDVKSRLEVPKGFITDTATMFGDLIGIPVSEMDNLAAPEKSGPFSKIVQRWFEHMDEWRVQHEPSGITALVLHRPKLPYGKSILIIHKGQKEDFVQKWKQTVLP